MNTEQYSIASSVLIRPFDKPQWHDILPLKVSIWLYFSVKSIPHVIQEVKQYYEEYKEMKIKEQEEAEALAAEEAQQSKPSIPIYKQILRIVMRGQFCRLIHHSGIL